MKRFLSILFWCFNGLLTVVLVGVVVFILKVKITPPEVDESIQPQNYNRIEVAENHYKIGPNWLKKNDDGIWEMYLEGEAYERGVIYGVLAKELIESQEAAFVNQINELIPSQFFQQVLRVFIAWFNRDMDEYIPEENLKEIYGISKSFADKYDFIGPKLYRIMYYHAAHDIGHALSDLRVVGCTSFSVKDTYSQDGKLIVGRNFDFYMGEDFAKDKLLVFVKPDRGFPFSSYAWAGFTGVVSGLNTAGVSVTLNASKSAVPLSAKEPISILAREILQYSGTIAEAVDMAEARETFVSESILIGSAADRNSAIIEKGPEAMDVYRSNQDYLYCSNHYQSEYFLGKPVNQENIDLTDTRYRWERAQELIETNKPLNVVASANILRNRKGEEGKALGLGNPRALNQLIAHHSVLFKPEDKLMWVSTAPFQLGSFLCYNLDDVFGLQDRSYRVDSLKIPADPFLYSSEFSGFNTFRKGKEQLIKYHLLGRPLAWSNSDIQGFIAANPESYEVYVLLGKYFQQKNNPCVAEEYFQRSFTKVFASKKEELEVKELLNACKEACSKGANE